MPEGSRFCERCGGRVTVGAGAVSVPYSSSAPVASDYFSILEPRLKLGGFTIHPERSGGTVAGGSGCNPEIGKRVDGKILTGNSCHQNGTGGRTGDQELFGDNDKVCPGLDGNCNDMA